MNLNQKTDEEIKEIALGIHSGNIFCDRHLQKPDDISFVFIPLILNDGALSEDDLKQIGMIYEYMDEASSRGINGYPCFYSMRILGKEDAKKVLEKVEEIRKALDCI